MLPDLSDDPSSIAGVGIRWLVAERSGQVGRGGADRTDQAGRDLPGAAADRGGVGEQVLGPNLVEHVLLR